MTRVFQARVDALDTDALADAIYDAAVKGAQDAADEIVALHQASIRARRAPDGGEQKRNSPGWSRAKGNRPPLQHTGQLLNNVRVVDTNKGATIEPPPNRRSVVESLHERGYDTIFNTDDREFEDTVQDAVDDESTQVDPNAFTQRRRL